MLETRFLDFISLGTTNLEHISIKMDLLLRIPLSSERKVKIFCLKGHFETILVENPHYMKVIYRYNLVGFWTLGMRTSSMLKLRL